MASPNSTRHRSHNTQGVQIRMRGDRNGDELSHVHTKVSLSANIVNKLSRVQNEPMTYIARQATLGRLLIIGERPLSLQKTIASQKAAFQATQQHSASVEASKEKQSLGTQTQETNTWQTKSNHILNTHRHRQIYPMMFTRKSKRPVLMARKHSPRPTIIPERHRM